MMTRVEQMPLSEMIQSYFDKLYHPCNREIHQSFFSKSNEIYGELYYYSIVELLKHLEITENDHFLDIGSGLGKVVFQVFLTTNAASVTGIEINQQRHAIAGQIAETIRRELPAVFEQNHTLNFINNDFLKQDFVHISIIYVCSTVFEAPLLDAIGHKINQMHTVKKVVSSRKLPNLDHFEITEKFFLHGSWDKVAFYLYCRKAVDG